MCFAPSVSSFSLPAPAYPPTFFAADKNSRLRRWILFSLFPPLLFFLLLFFLAFCFFNSRAPERRHSEVCFCKLPMIYEELYGSGITGPFCFTSRTSFVYHPGLWLLFEVSDWIRVFYFLVKRNFLFGFKKSFRTQKKLNKSRPNFILGQTLWN